MHVNIFDFDGVLAYPLEEALFNLELNGDSRRFMEKMTLRHSLNLEGESEKSAHYICMQAALWDLGYPIKRGPMFHKVAHRPYHILTARSDRFAVARVQVFLEANLIDKFRPIKIMHTDHLPKGEILKVLLDRHPENTYSFYDDREKHINSALSLNNPRLSVFHVDNDMSSVYEEASTFYYDTILRHNL